MPAANSRVRTLRARLCSARAAAECPLLPCMPQNGCSKGCCQPPCTIRHSAAAVLPLPRTPRLARAACPVARCWPAAVQPSTCTRHMETAAGWLRKSCSSRSSAFCSQSTQSAPVRSPRRTRTWTWRARRPGPTASCGRWWAPAPSRWAHGGPPPGTGGTCSRPASQAVQRARVSRQPERQGRRPGGDARSRVAALAAGSWGRCVDAQGRSARVPAPSSRRQSRTGRHAAARMAAGRLLVGAALPPRSGGLPGASGGAPDPAATPAARWEPGMRAGPALTCTIASRLLLRLVQKEGEACRGPAFTAERRSMLDAWALGELSGTPAPSIRTTGALRRAPGRRPLG